MRLGADDVSWRWIDALGKEQSGVKWDLVALLSNGTLPPKTLVWKTGWAQWFAASRIAELADALPPDSIEARVSPPSSNGVVKPPPPPAPDSRASLVDADWGSAPPPPEVPKPAAVLLPEPPSEASRASADRTPIGNLKLPRPNLTPPKIVLPSERKSQPRNEKPEPEPERASPPSSFGLLGLQKEKPKPPTAVVSTQSATFAAFERTTDSYAGNRPPLPTLSDESAPATATLRPPAAVPPPPRSALGAPVLDPRVLSRLSREKSAIDTPLPVAPASEEMSTVPNKRAAVGDITVDDTAETRRRDVLSPVQPQRVPLSREASARSPAHTPPVHVLGEARPPMPTIPDALEVLGDARPIQPTIPESAPAFSRAPSELAPAIIHAGPVVELGRAPAPPPPVRRAPLPAPLPPPSHLPPPSARPVVKPVPPLEITLSSGAVDAQVPAPRSDTRNALSSTGSPAGMELDARANPRPDDALEEPPVRRFKPAFLALGGAAAACALVGGFVLLSRQGASPELTEPPAQSASAAPVVTPVACRVQAHPARLGATIDRSVTPLLEPLASGRAALGFAESPKKALGVVITTDTLDAEPSFQKAFDQPLRSVVPLVASGNANFFARADSEALKNPRAVDGPKPFVIGAGESSILRAAGSDPPQAIWPIPPKSAVTELRVASNGAGHLVTFRVGGLEGKEMVGFLDLEGAKKTDLAALDTPKLVGTPFAALGKERWAVVFAARETNQDPWHVELVTGALGSTQGTRTKFEAPPGGLGGGQIAPSIAALARDHWLLQWTEGKTGMYQVRTVALDPKLAPVGEALIVSPKGASSGQGALFSAGDRSVSLYVQTIGGHDELWATTLDCR
jgi:hypothetical protein